MMAFHRIAALSLAVLAFAVALPASPAQAVTVTTGGTTYDIEFFPGGESFLDNQAALESTPWWGDTTLALNLASAYATQVPAPYPFDENVGNDFLFFTYSHSAATAYSAVVTDGSVVSTATTGDASSNSGYHFAYAASPTPVPEIDGNALGQAALILLALWLVLRGRRQGTA